MVKISERWITSEIPVVSLLWSKVEKKDDKKPDERTDYDETKCSNAPSVV